MTDWPRAASAASDDHDIRLPAPRRSSAPESFAAAGPPASAQSPTGQEMHECSNLGSAQPAIASFSPVMNLASATNGSGHASPARPYRRSGGSYDSGEPPLKTPALGQVCR